MIESLSVRLNHIQNTINRAAEKSGREGSSIVLVAVTKTVPVDIIAESLTLGIKHIGENRVQEAQEKRMALNLSGYSTTHHCLGHLQTNKARKAVQLFDVIQSVDSVRLLDTLNRLGAEVEKQVRILLELKMGSEPSKSGVSLADIDKLLAHAQQQPNLIVEGFMTIAPLGLSIDETRECFGVVKKEFDRRRHLFSGSGVLSMGMSDDFELAIEEGSTMVRLGRRLFGERS